MLHQFWGERYFRNLYPPQSHRRTVDENNKINPQYSITLSGKHPNEPEIWCPIQRHRCTVHGNRNTRQSNLYDLIQKLKIDKKTKKYSRNKQFPVFIHQIPALWKTHQTRNTINAISNIVKLRRHMKTVYEYLVKFIYLMGKGYNPRMAAVFT